MSDKKTKTTLQIVLTQSLTESIMKMKTLQSALKQCKESKAITHLLTLSQWLTLMGLSKRGRFNTME